MKFAITGHSQGLGSAIGRLIVPPNTFLGFSRSNGFDISTFEGRSRILDEIHDCDVFINNAHSAFAQTELLYELFDIWKGQKKLIVNIGSDTTVGVKNKPWPYTSHKMALHKASEQLSYQKDSCKVMLIRFGWIGTERILREIKPVSYIQPSDAAQYVMDQIQWAQKYNIAEALLIP